MEEKDRMEMASKICDLIGHDKVPFIDVVAEFIKQNNIEKFSIRKSSVDDTVKMSLTYSGTAYDFFTTENENK